MGKFCPNCSFDLSSILVKNNSTNSKIEKPQKSIIEEDDEDIITKISKNLVLKKNKKGEVNVSAKQSDKRLEHLAKAREVRKQKAEEKKRLKESSTPQNSPEPENQPKPQQNTEYTNFYNLF